MKNWIAYSISGVSILTLLAAGFACKKDSDQAESQGTRFDLLQKTVTTYSYSSRKTTVNYSYNTSRQLVKIDIADNDPLIASVSQTETFVRNASGQLDTSRFESYTNSALTYRTNTVYTYDAGGKLLLSVQQTPMATMPYTDSCLYIYSGNILQQRKDYRRFDGTGPYDLLRTANFQFDGQGNLSRTIFTWTTHPIPDTATFQYDNKVNALPVDRLVFYWAPLFYNDYKPVNNPLQAVNAKGDFPSYNYEYRYTGNSKPLYRKMKIINSSEFTETLYYYD